MTAIRTFFRPINLLLLLLLLSCGPTVAPTTTPGRTAAVSAVPTLRPPVVPPTTSPRPTPVVPPGGTAAPTSRPSPSAPPIVEPPLEVTQVASPGATASFPLTFYGLALFYDPARWEVRVGSGELEVLAHREIAGCNIREQGPTEPPPIDGEKDIGPVHYLYSVDLPIQEGEVERWYLAESGYGPPSPAGLPVLIVTAPVREQPGCIDAAEELLATLREP